MAEYIGLKLIMLKQIELTKELQQQVAETTTALKNLEGEMREWLDGNEDTASEYTLNGASESEEEQESEEEEGLWYPAQEEDMFKPDDEHEPMQLEESSLPVD
jgi:hypothetical protein